MNRFKLVSEFGPKGDQPQAIEAFEQGCSERAPRLPSPSGCDRLWKNLHHGQCH